MSDLEESFIRIDRMVGALNGMASLLRTVFYATEIEGEFNETAPSVEWHNGDQWAMVEPWNGYRDWMVTSNGFGQDPDYAVRTLYDAVELVIEYIRQKQ